MEKSAIEKLKAINENRNRHLGYMNGKITHDSKNDICLRENTHTISSFNKFIHKAISLNWDMILKTAFELEQANYSEIQELAKR